MADTSASSPSGHAGGQVVHSQTDLVQPLEDSQEMSYDVVEYSTPDQHAQNSYPIHQASHQATGSYFARPTLESAEEIAAGFQFNKPPSTRNVFSSSDGLQKNLRPQSVFNAQNTYRPPMKPEMYESSQTNERQELTHLGTYGKGMRDEVVAPRENGAVRATIESRWDANKTGHTSRRPDTVDKRDLISSPNSPGVPFPDETDLIPSSKRKIRPTRSPLSHAQLPKSITDTRQKALVQLSPHSRAPILKPRSSSTRLHMESSSSGRARKTSPAESKQYPQDRESSETIDQMSDGPDVEIIKRASEKRVQARRPNTQSLTRPIPDMGLHNEVVNAIRLDSPASNISKQRIPMRRHKEGTPTRQQNDLYLKKFAVSWNTNYIYNQQLLDRWEKKIIMLEKHIQDQSSTIEQCHVDIGSRNETINTLRSELEEEHAQSQSVSNEIATASSMRKKLEQKLKLTRDRLNDAIREQQQLYLRCKEKFQETTASVEEESQVQKESVEKATTTVELLRAEIGQKVFAAVGDANRQVDELNKTIESLEAQLGHSEQELQRQRDQAASLREQLAEAHRLSDQSLQSIAAQNRELLESLNRCNGQANEAKRDIQDQGTKLDNLLATLTEAKSKTIDDATLAEILKGIQGGTVNAIAAEIQNSAQSSRSSELEDRQDLNDNVDQVRVLCNDLADMVTEVKSHADWQVKASEADMTIRGQLSQIQNLQDELHQARAHLQDKSNEQSELQGQMNILQANAETGEIAAAKVNDLTAEVQQLQQSLNEKNVVATGSKRDLAIAQEQLRLETRKLREQIQNERQEHAAAIESSARERDLAISQAAEQAQKTREEHQLKERQLQEVNSQVQRELDAQRTAVIENEASTVANLHRIVDDLIAGKASAGELKQKVARLEAEKSLALETGSELRDFFETTRTEVVGPHETFLAVAEAEIAAEKKKRNNGATKESTAKPAATNVSKDDAHSLAVPDSSLKNLKRKVMMKTPISDDDPVSSVSIEEERNARRSSAPRRGIIKLPTSSPSEVLEATGSGVEGNPRMPEEPQPTPKRRVAQRGSKPALNIHSQYNRPVAGFVPMASQKQEDEDQVGYSSGHKSNANAGGATSGEGSSMQDLEEQPMKRQRTADVKPRAKLAHSMHVDSPALKLEDEETPEAPKAISSRGGPLKRIPSGLITYGSSSQQNVSKNL